jgi:hypothetical protein
MAYGGRAACNQTRTRAPESAPERLDGRRARRGAVRPDRGVEQCRHAASREQRVLQVVVDRQVAQRADGGRLVMNDGAGGKAGRAAALGAAAGALAGDPPARGPELRVRKVCAGVREEHPESPAGGPPHLRRRRAVAQQAEQPLDAALRAKRGLASSVERKILQRAGGRLLGRRAAVLAGARGAGAGRGWRGRAARARTARRARSRAGGPGRASPARVAEPGVRGVRS